jgi:hypothetical protein
MVNNDNFLIKEIPIFHPISQKFERINFFKDIKRKMFEGMWSGNRWCPPELFFHVNLSTIQFLGGGRKVSGIGRPWFRDIEWEKAYIYTEACGFSGFRDDPEYTCLREVQEMTKEEIYNEFCLDHHGNLIEDNYKALFKKDGSLKKYMPAREYLWRTDMNSSFGPHMYLNQAKNVVDFEGRGCLAEGTEVLMYDGSIKKIEDIVIGDELMGKDSTCRTVLDIHSGEDYLYTLRHSDKSFDDITVTKDHRVSIKKRCYNNGKYVNGKRTNGTYHYEYVDYTVEELKNVESQASFKDVYHRYKPNISLEFKNSKTPTIDPYYFGLWLADGRSNCTSIKTTDPVLWEYLENFAKDNKIDYKVSITKAAYNRKEAREYYYKDNYFRQCFKDYGLLYKKGCVPDKYIPNDFLTATKDVRLQLLAGIIDGDGTYDTNRKHFVICVGLNKDLANSYLRLVQSLGFRGSLTSRNRKGYKKIFMVRVSGNIETIPTKLYRKQASKIIHRVDLNSSSFKIEPKGFGKYYGLVVDVDGEYLLKDFSVDHNSGKSYWASSCIQHNLLTDGARSYDAYLEGRKTGNLKSISQTLVGAIEAKYSMDLLDKVKFSLEHLPGKLTIRINGEDKDFPSPLMPELSGSWAPAKSIRDTLSGSSIVHRTFQDNPLAANGTRPNRAFIEEVGFMSNIQEVLGAVEATQPNKQTNKYLPIYMLGTGGYTTTGTAIWLKEIFYNPEAFDCLAFDDVWENKGKIGYFLPATKSQNDFKEGPNLISNEEKALESIMKAREKAKSSNNKVKLLTEIINQPIKPSEVFKTIEGNFFPTEELTEILADLESKEYLLNSTHRYEFNIIKGKVVPKVSDKQPIREFPLRKGLEMDACVEIFELPKRDKDGNIPYGRYLAGWDPVETDGNEDTNQSLQSLIILDSWTDRIVAEYTARTYISEEYYEQARRLLMFYNAICNYESNIKGPYGYFKNKNSLHLLCDTPEILKDESLIKTSNIGNKSKGTRTNASIIDWGLRLVLTYLETQAYDKPEGYRNMDTIKSPAILKELISYSPEINTDRVSALIMLMILREDRARITDISRRERIKTKANDRFWKKHFNKALKIPNYR